MHDAAPRVVQPIETSQALRAESSTPRLPPSAESPPPRDPLDRLGPSQHVPQRVAFSRYRLAALEGEEMVARRLSDFQVVARFEVPDARNVAALTGGGFIAAGRDHVYRLSGVEQRAELLPRAPRLGPTSLWPSSQDAAEFWLHYAGLSSLARFDLGQVPLASTLVVLDSIALPEFDQQALWVHRNGRAIYTTARGLAASDVYGHVQRFSRADLAGQIWALLPAARPEQIWAVTSHHAELLELTPALTNAARLELPPHVVAAASRGSDLGLLSLEGLGERAFRFRLDVRSGASAHVLRFSMPAPETSTQVPFELDLSPATDHAAIYAGSLAVYDWRSGQRLLPAGELEGAGAAAQKLAPSPR